MHKYYTMKVSELLTEGVNDPSIFKCIFVIGGPGSGKSQVTDMLGLRGLGFVTVNSDEALQYLMQKRGLSLKMPPEEEPQRTQVRARAKEITRSKMELAVDGRLGLVVDGTGEDKSKVDTIRSRLAELGYEFYLVVVQASLETALRRNAMRPRSVPEEIVKKKWLGVQRNIDKFTAAFPDHIAIDNNGSLRELSQQTEAAYVQLRRWAKSKPSSPVAAEWIQDQRSTKK